MSDWKCTVRLNPIVRAQQYYGIFDGDPRIEDLGERLVNCMRKSGVFDSDIAELVLSAGKSKEVHEINEAIERLYDYADEHDINLGIEGEEPADAKTTPN